MIIISFVFHLQTFTASIGEASTYQEWLRVQQSTIVKLNQINYSHVSGLRQCACYQLKRRGYREVTCSFTDGANEPLFLREIIRQYDGKTVSEKVTCEEILDALIYKRLEQDWGEMRAHLSLMQSPDIMADPIKTETMQDLPLTSVFREKVDYLFPTSPQHNIRNIPLISKLNIAEVESLSETEIKNLIDDYFTFSSQTCLSLAPRFISASRWVAKAFGITDGDATTFCNKLILAHDGNIPLSESYRFRKYAESLLAAIQRTRVTDFRLKHKLKYLKTVQSNPLLLLVRSPKVELSQLAKILASIESNAQQRLHSSIEDLKLNRNSEVYGGMTYALPYTRAIWSGQGFDPKEFETYANRAYEAWQSEESRHKVIETIAVTALVGACVLPWGNALSASMQLLKFSCLAGIGIPFNTYFLIDSVNGYANALNVLFSSVEATQALENAMTNSTDKQLAVMLSAVLFPIGLNLVEAQNVLAAVKALGK